MLRAQVQLQLGHIDEAKAAAERAVALARGFSAPAQRLSAAVHAEAKEWPEAIAALDRIERPLRADHTIRCPRARVYGQCNRERARSESCAAREARRRSCRGAHSTGRGRCDPDVALS